MNGRISRPGAIQQFRLKVSPGQMWMLELEAAQLGTSRLYASLSVADPQGKRIDVSDVGNGVDPQVLFEVPEKTPEVTVTVTDIRGLGGPTYGYRLLAQPQAEDFSLRLQTPYVNIPSGGTGVIAVTADSHGYSGRIRLTIPDLPDDLSVQGGNVSFEIQNYTGIRERSTTGFLTITARPGSPARARKFSVWGEGEVGGRVIRRHAAGPGIVVEVNLQPMLSITGDPIAIKPLVAPWLNLDLPAAVSKALPVKLEVAELGLRLAQGIEQHVAWKLTKEDPAVVVASVGPFGVPEIKDFSVDTGDTKAAESGVMKVNSSFDTPLSKQEMVLAAKVQIDGKEETVVAPAITVEVVRPYTLAMASDRVEIKPGARVEVAGEIKREPVFAGLVKIRIPDPPEKVSCPDIDVSGGQSQFRIVCEAAAGADGGDFEVHVVSTAVIPGRKDNAEYMLPPVSAHLLVRADRPSAAEVHEERFKETAAGALSVLR